MPATTRQPAWVGTLRDALKHEHGRGWSVGPANGQVRLWHRAMDGTRSSVVLSMNWERSCVSAVIAHVAALRGAMEERGVSLPAAAELLASAPLSGPIDWPALVSDYLTSRSDLRPTTYRDLETRLQRMLATLNSRPVPRDGGELLRAYARQHFTACPPGGQGRKRQLLDVSRFLKWAVERRGAPVCWMPPPADHVAELIGARTEHVEATVPISPDQLAGLLDHLEASRPELWLAVALVGIYGLRPAELGVLQTRDQWLYVGTVKRNARTAAAPKPPRLVLPLELAGRDDGARALALYRSGLVQLPKAIHNAAATGQHKAVGDAFRQLLDRLPYWQSLVATTPGLTPYSLRHGFAWRGAHRQPAIPLRDLAAVMGHNPATHLRHYAKWTREQDLIASFKAAQGDTREAAARS